MNKIKKITQKEYADLMEKQDTAIRYRVRVGIPLPGVIKIERHGRAVIFHFDSSIDLKDARSSFRISNFKSA